MLQSLLSRGNTGVPWEIGFPEVAIVATIGIAGYLLILAIYQLYFSPISKIPGPWYAALSSVWLYQRYIRGGTIFVMDELHERYGPYVRVAPNIVSVADLHSVTKIHSVKDVFIKGSVYGAMSSNLDVLIVETDPTAFKIRRKMLGSTFNQLSMNLLEPIIRGHVDACLRGIREEIKANGFCNFCELAKLLGLDTAGHIAFGAHFPPLRKEKFNNILRDTTFMLSLTLLRGLPLFGSIETLLSKIPHFAASPFFSCECRLTEFSTKAFDNVQSEIPGCKNGGLVRPLFAKISEDMNDESAKNRLTIKQARDEAFIMLLAGSDTVGLALVFLVWALLKHEDVHRKLDEELKALGNVEIEDSILQPLPYLKSFIQEGLRMYAPLQVPLPRVVPQGGRQLGDYFFPGGVEAMPATYTIMRDPEIFPNPQS
ncbi:hypothetical protein TWF694_005832 [Orbilia ellipsospora]|uniref:Cytochrome P450 n=1 Tax=Orbilia ellipsospora TaxID=2528407 RepID=A0AAV9WTG0_9PEZI